MLNKKGILIMNGTDMEGLLQRISVLEEENAQLRNWQRQMNTLCSQMLDMLEQQKADLDAKSGKMEELWRFESINRWRIDSLPYELRDPDYKSEVFKPHFYTVAETRRLIIEGHKSIARLGDGEFSAIAGMQRWNFQGRSEKLAARLLEVLQSNRDDMLIGLNPTFYMDLSDLPELDADGVRAYMRPEVRRQHAALLDRERHYADALFHNMYSEKDVEEIKNIWRDRDCVIVEGVHTGSGVGNDMFDGCKSIKRILCPAENAFDCYDEILNAALEQNKDSLMLLALGPTATVLAYDLCCHGYQAVDIGHTDLIYEKYRSGLQDLYQVKIPYKYCSADERIKGREIPDIDDKDYLAQVVARII